MFLSHEQICGTSQLERSLLYSQGGSRQGVLHAPVRVQIAGMSQAVALFRPVSFLIQRNS